MTYPKGSYEYRILSFLQRNKKASLAELFPVVRIDTSRVKDIVKELVKRDELVEFKPGHFRLGPAAPGLDEAGTDGGLEAELLAALAARGRASRNVLASAVGQPPALLMQVLRTLSERGLIHLDGSAWVLTSKGEAKAPKTKVPPGTEDAPPSPKARGRRRISPAPVPAPPTTRPAAASEVPGAPAEAMPSPLVAVPPPPKPSHPSLAAPVSPATVKAPQQASATGAPSAPELALSKRGPTPAAPPGAWDEAFVFVPLPREAKAAVLDEVLDLSDLGQEATSKDGWVELRWDAGRRVLAVVPVAERSRHAVRMEDGRVTSPHPVRLLGAGAFGVAWDADTKAFLVSISA